MRRDNVDWRTAHLSPLQRQAALWQQTADQRESLLLGKSALEEAESWAAVHQQELEPHELAYLEASRQAIAREEQARKATYTAELQKVGWLALTETVLFVAVIVLVIFATVFPFGLGVAMLLLIAALALGIAVIFRTLRTAWYSRQGRVIRTASPKHSRRLRLPEASLLARITGILFIGAFGSLIAMMVAIMVIALKSGSSTSEGSASAYYTLVPFGSLIGLLFVAAIVSGGILAIRLLLNALHSHRKDTGP